MKYEDITEHYNQRSRVEFILLDPSNELTTDDLIKTPDGRILIPADWSEANLFPVYGELRGKIVLVAEFSTAAEAQKFIQQRTGEGQPDAESGSTNEDITEFYRAKKKTPLSEIQNGGHELFIAELIRTPDHRILIPEMAQGGANLFAVFAGTDELVLVDTFSGFESAALFLEEAKGKGWDVLRGRNILPGIRWLAQVKPGSALASYPWIEEEFDWLPIKLFWKKWRVESRVTA